MSDKVVHHLGTPPDLNCGFTVMQMLVPVNVMPPVAALTAPEQLLDEADVLQMLKISQRTLFRLLKSDAFPPGIFLSPNIRRWTPSSIMTWLQAREALGGGRVSTSALKLVKTTYSAG
jgi:predicted DNA-binding transcriptional regulator AlpA